VSVAFGLSSDATVLTPRGPVPLGALSAGDTVWAFDPEAGAWSEARVVAAPTWTVDQVVDVVFDGGTLHGVTPGTGVWDAFEEGWRAVGSLSTLSRLLVGGRDGLEERGVVTTVEHAVDREVRHLTLAAPHLAFVVGGVVVRHKEA
jgi:hypothetical protein